jgi:hypothetical protein
VAGVDLTAQAVLNPAVSTTPTRTSAAGGRSVAVADDAGAEAEIDEDPGPDSADEQSHDPAMLLRGLGATRVSD